MLPTSGRYPHRPLARGGDLLALAVQVRPDEALGKHLQATAAILERRGYAVGPARLGELCLGGPAAEQAVRAAIATGAGLELRDGLVLRCGSQLPSTVICRRARAHPNAAGEYLPATLGFVRALVATAPFVISVSVAGSLASGGFEPSDDVDLNLVVEDGYRHLAYVVLNALGLLHALRYRGKPVDELSRRPLAPRLMTANLILERSDWFPLRRQDEEMAFELLVQEPVFGRSFLEEAITANPTLLEHFPQLARRPARWSVAPGRRAPRWSYPRPLEGLARRLGSAAWGYMMWTRRRSPAALRRVELVRRTMRPYTLFDSAAGSSGRLAATSPAIGRETRP